ncbi:restriction endonuclease subunit S [Pediococcus pentosaceus]|uniref:restriction endonuclease subunit S n=1 Tax=Pediococcus pentosaceus TaxID=1255 RepID=UPI00223B0B89|nr:restriction endonuclease subunit S [Pediococcus pentosaceus]MCT1178621.1 restriction endonuclease subunit S [Pediococcus pentosaceus]
MENEDKNRVPKLRYPGYTDPWVLRKLGEVVNITMGQSPSSVNYTDDSSYDVLVQGNADLKNGWVIPRVWTKQVTKKGKRGDIILSVRAPVGEVAKTSFDVVLGRGVASVTGNEFVYQALLRLKTNGYWRRLSTGSTFESINSNDIKNANLFFTEKNEQQAIGSLFKKIDNLIVLQQRKIEHLRKRKAGLLQKMFPKDGADVPEVRFPEYTDAWVQQKLEELLDKSNGLRRGPFGSALKKEFFVSKGKYTVYEQNNAINNIWKTRYFINQEKFQELHKFQLMPGDFILSGAGTIGRIAQVPYGITKGVFNQALIRIRINPEYTNEKFFLIWMQSEKMQRKLTQANPGSAMTNLVPMSEIKKWEIMVPRKTEQKKIGEFIQKINSLITLQQRKLEHLELQKRGLLQQMFV